ncbi:unnamed protein product [Musa acuminata subsp. malaccensis]|uniref:(wild Malaysian banana) hypothetical protein n=1 Tax=Musa acuminata subsp. malaccensis TaxID=214687 RepID=A0A804J538_MUSAM|nr:PREDICTED: uncharacterized protein LOC103985142 [Musa acuminata subsp. malaccensis]CAG1838932.1 unnamed protein product [Musa acuminata subsp. malaccensis]
MSPVVKLLLFAALLLHISTTADCQGCDLSSIQVQQTNTGEKAGNDKVFEVEVKNVCSCTISSVFLRSVGFSSSIVVDPKQFRREGTDYVVNDGKGIPSSQSIKFHYAWDRAFAMSPASLKVNC